MNVYTHILSRICIYLYVDTGIFLGEDGFLGVQIADIDIGTGDSYIFYPWHLRTLLCFF
jgi:hypothetical protein